MRPFVTEKSCLKCHAVQGYKEGDIRGGISISQPLGELMAMTKKNNLMMSLMQCLLWLLGIGGIGLTCHTDSKHESSRTGVPKLKPERPKSFWRMCSGLPVMES